MTVLITLTTAGSDSGPFNLYSNLDGYLVPFATNVSKVALLAGYTSTVVPDFTNSVKVQSISGCVNFINIILQNTTTSTSSTTSTTTSSLPLTYPVMATCCGFGTTEYVIWTGVPLSVGEVIDSNSQGFLGGYEVLGPLTPAIPTITELNSTVYGNCGVWSAFWAGSACV